MAFEYTSTVGFDKIISLNLNEGDLRKILNSLLGWGIHYTIQACIHEFHPKSCNVSSCEQIELTDRSTILADSLQLIIESNENIDGSDLKNEEINQQISYDWFLNILYIIVNVPNLPVATFCDYIDNEISHTTYQLSDFNHVYKEESKINIIRLMSVFIITTKLCDYNYNWQFEPELYQGLGKVVLGFPSFTIYDLKNVATECGSYISNTLTETDKYSIYSQSMIDLINSTIDYFSRLESVDYPKFGEPANSLSEKIAYWILGNIKFNLDNLSTI